MTEMTLNDLLRDQMEWHWTQQLRPRLDGLTDEEYFWEPAPECWNVRSRGASTAPVQAGSGMMTIDFAFPEPDPPPLTTIAWRLGHVIVGVLAMRNAAHFGRELTDYGSFAYAETATAALDQLDQEYRRWMSGVQALTAEALAAPCGEEEPFRQASMSRLVLHIHRELIHHGAEVGLLRDLYRATEGR
ncbi:MAG TPA: DinB family protein [Ornithinimicrobium sp.]|uniref:DinB family protein n=1 Tax=Ornithinimicrobium sp. TaxID=1977084 RepID=UPI002B465ED6|nr:DinB family protein [Ornithinimicrobium sp.]HKJ12748.1 DinB family protein [Ornithinimicrobium sp.]